MFGIDYYFFELSITNQAYPFQLVLNKNIFCLDEPVLRSLDLLGGDGFIDRYCHKLVLQDIMTSSLAHPTSIIVRNESNQIVGMKKLNS